MSTADALPRGRPTLRGHIAIARIDHWFKNVFVLPGALFETPGYFRISLTASEDMVEGSLPHFRAAMERAGQNRPTDWQ